MTEVNQMRVYLNEAKTLLDYVYYYAGDNGNTPLEDNMSRADSCIIEAFDFLKD